MTHPDATPGIAATVDVGATVPWLPRAALAALLVGLVLVAGGAGIIVAASHRALTP